MQQHADICPALLMRIHKVLGNCRHGGHKRIQDEKQKLMKDDLQPIDLKLPDILFCNCGTIPPAGNSQDGLQPLSQTRLTRTEDLSQRIDRLQHYVESKLASYHMCKEGIDSTIDRTEYRLKKLFPSAFLAMEETTIDNEDADSQIFNSSTEGEFCSYDLSRKINRLQHSVESMLVSKRDLIHSFGSRFDRLENMCKRACPEAFLTTMEETTQVHDDADITILGCTLKDVPPNYNLFQRLNSLQHFVNILVPYGDEFVRSIISRTRNLHTRVHPYVVLEQIKTRMQAARCSIVL